MYHCCTFIALKPIYNRQCYEGEAVASPFTHHLKFSKKKGHMPITPSKDKHVTKNQKKKKKKKKSGKVGAMDYMCK